jgi:peptidyl-prolyl cis-trans isomerase B (cyclophilin B)
MAIAALVSALVFAPLGIVFGHIALSQLKHSGEDGKGLAIAGVVLGYVGTAIFLLALIFYVVLLSALSSGLP